MPESLAELLVTTSANVRANNARVAEEAKSKVPTETGLTPDQEEEAVSEFVTQNFDWAVDEITSDAIQRAKHGELTSETTWLATTSLENVSGIDLAARLMRYRGLREKMIEHFTALGIVASEVDTRSGYWREPTDPDSPVEREWAISDTFVIGVRLSWEEPEATDQQPDLQNPSELRDRLGANEWLASGQASTL